MEGSHRSDTSLAIDEHDKPPELGLRQLGLTIPLPAPLLEHRELFPRLADAGYTTPLPPLRRSWCLPRCGEE